MFSSIASAWYGVPTVEQTTIAIDNTTVETQVIDVFWNATKDGYLIPSIKHEKIQLTEVESEYVSGFNAKYITDNKIGKGTILKILRVGEVIPSIVEVIKGTEPSMPNEDYIWDENRVHIIKPSTALLMIKLCKSNRIDTVKTVIDSIRYKITPSIYDRCFLIASENENLEICLILAKYDFYPLEFNIIKRLLLLACKTGSVELYEFATKYISNDMSHMPLLLSSIKYQHLMLVSHIIEKYSKTLNIPKLLSRLGIGKYFIFDQYKKTTTDTFFGFTTTFKRQTHSYTDCDGKKYVCTLTDLNVIKMEDPLFMSRSNVEIFKLLLPVILPHYTLQQRLAFIVGLIDTTEAYGIIGLNELRNNGSYLKYDRKYFDMATKYSRSAEISQFLAECFQKK